VVYGRQTLTNEFRELPTRIESLETESETPFSAGNERRFGLYYRSSQQHLDPRAGY